MRLTFRRAFALVFGGAALYLLAITVLVVLDVLSLVTAVVLILPALLAAAGFVALTLLRLRRRFRVYVAARDAQTDRFEKEAQEISRRFEEAVAEVSEVLTAARATVQERRLAVLTAFSEASWPVDEVTGARSRGAAAIGGDAPTGTGSAR